MNRLNEFGVQPFKDALKLDYAMAMVAWLSLRKAQKGARYPQILEEADFDRQFSAALDAFDAGEIGREELRLRLERLYNGLGIRKPLLSGGMRKTAITACCTIKRTAGSMQNSILWASGRKPPRRDCTRRCGAILCCGRTRAARAG